MNIETNEHIFYESLLKSYQHDRDYNILSLSLSLSLFLFPFIDNYLSFFSLYLFFFCPFSHGYPCLSFLSLFLFLFLF